MAVYYQKKEPYFELMWITNELKFECVWITEMVHTFVYMYFIELFILS